jgi:hypothetical protein
VVKDGVAEAEAKAAKERQMVPLEIRVKKFTDMLTEKEGKGRRKTRNLRFI